MRRAALLLACCALFPGGWSWAEEPVGSLDGLVQALAARMNRTLAGRELKRVDIALVLRAGTGVSARLTQVVRGLVQARLWARGPRSVGVLPAVEERQATVPGRPPGSVSRARAAGYELLVDLELVVVEGHLHLRGTLHGTDRVLWRDMVQPDPGALSHLHASIRVDAEVRAYLGSPAAAVRFSPRRHPLGRGEVLAMGAGDLDGDGKSELVLLHPDAVQILRHRGGGGFAPAWSFRLSAALAPLRPRRTMGTLLVVDLDGDRRVEIFARSSEQERGEELALAGKELVSRRQFDGYPLLVQRGARGQELVLGAPLPGLDLFSTGSLSPALTPALPEAQRSLPGTFYALNAARITAKRGQRRYWALVDPGGMLQLCEGEVGRIILSWPRVGVALDLVDLDDDGHLEVITTGADSPEAEDQVNVFRLTRNNSLRLLFSSAGTGGPVQALTHGDFDGNGKLELVGVVRQRSGALSLLVLN